MKGGNHVKAGEVMKVLHVSRQTIKHYLDRGYIKATKMPNGRYDYDEKSVYDYRNQNIPRQTVLYARVSTYKQKPDLKNQVNKLTKFANSNGYTINNVYQDIASGISFEKRKEFFELLDLVIQYKIDKVIITHKDRLSRVGFDLFKHLFGQFGTEIVVMDDRLDEKTDEQEIMSEIISLLHCFAMKQYSKRRQR